MAKKAKGATAVLERPVEDAVPVQTDPAPEAPKPERKSALEESREALKHPLPAGQIFFESPEGYVMVGESTTDRLFCRQANGGSGLWINPMRTGSYRG